MARVYLGIPGYTRATDFFRSQENKILKYCVEKKSNVIFMFQNDKGRHLAFSNNAIHSLMHNFLEVGKMTCGPGIPGDGLIFFS